MSLLVKVNDTRSDYVNNIKKGREILDEDLHEYLFSGRMSFPRISLLGDEFNDLCYILSVISEYQKILIKTWINDFPNDILDKWYTSDYINCLICMINPFENMILIYSAYKGISREDNRNKFIEFIKKCYSQDKEKFNNFFSFITKNFKDSSKHQRNLIFLKIQFCFP